MLSGSDCVEKWPYLAGGFFLIFGLGWILAEPAVSIK